MRPGGNHKGCNPEILGNCGLSDSGAHEQTQILHEKLTAAGYNRGGKGSTAMMRSLTTSILVALLGVACTSNPVAPQPPSAPEAPAPPPLPAAPKAVLSVGRGDSTPPVAVVNFTQILFDGSRSEGDGVTYLLEYGDGASSTEPVTTRRPNPPGGSPPTPKTLMIAKLTVTDRHGRTDSTTQPYFLASVGNVYATFWHGDPPGCCAYLNLYLTQDGATLSGDYWGWDNLRTFGGRVAGVLTDDRAIRLKTVDGAIEFIGTVELRPSPPGQPDPILRLSMRGGGLDGSVIEFEFADPY